MKLKDNSAQEIDTALYQLEQKLKSNIRLTDVENSNASTAKINAVDKKLTEEIKDRQSADEKLQVNINKEIADRKDADAAIENAKQDKLIAGNNIQIDGNIISATPAEYTAEAPVKVTDGKISLDTVPITKGGTGVTTQADINKAFIGNLEIGNSDVTDGTEFVSSWASDKGFAETTEGALNKPYKRQFIKVWNYIKGKISSVLGLTKDNYGGKSATAGTADTVDNYHASQLWRSDGANWNPNANVTMAPSGNNSEWSFDFINKNGATGSYWHVWDEDKSILLKVNADDGKVSAPYGFVGNLSGKADTAGTADSAAAILDSNNGTPIKVRWGGSAIDSAEWYPAFNADGSVLGPINRANIHVGTADTSNLTTGVKYTGEGVGCISAAQTSSPVNNSPADWASYIICNHGNGTTYYHQMLRLPFFSDTIQLQRRVAGELKGWKNVAIMENENTWSGRQNFTTAKASSKMVIPIGTPSNLEDGCIWIS